MSNFNSNQKTGNRNTSSKTNTAGNKRPRTKSKPKAKSKVNSAPKADPYQDLQLKKRNPEKTKTNYRKKRNSNGAKAAPAKVAPAKKAPAKTGRKNHQNHGKKASNLKVIPLGGLNEIGKNLTVLEYKDQILIVDCGLSFPEIDQYGIDVVIPDITYLEEHAKDKKILGMVITHGHEDHIGAIPYLLKKFNVPIYGTRITLGLIKNKLQEHGIKGDFHPVKAGDCFKIGDFKVETIRTTHSVADAICLYIETPAATLFHTGDFKIDYTPIDGEPINLAKFAEIGQRGVDIMLADSTNVLRPGYTQSEKLVGQTLDGIFRGADSRIIVATFSSNVHRVQKIIELTAKYGRKFSVSGRSMENVVQLAEELGYLKIPANTYVPLDKAKTYPDSKMVIITTGSQGEPMAALSRMAIDEHRNIKLKKGDMVILSSTPVPGNEKTVSNIVNKLYDKEVEVIYNDIADIHVSGHACQEELKLIHSLIKPTFFMPVHGESRHLVQHGRLAESLGMDKNNIFILSNGDQLTVDRKKAVKFRNVVSAEDILVDGLGIGDVGNVVLKDRKQLSESGLIIVTAAVDRREGLVLSGPEVVSRGFVYVRENGELMHEAKKVAEKAINDCMAQGTTDWNEMKNAVRISMRRFIFKKTKRNPIILPIFLDN